jgi:membrane protein YdbS with pleckstrin-like domain
MKHDMERNQNESHQPYKAKNSARIAVFALLVLPILLSSCSVIEGIFKAGMGVGIFAVLAVAVVVVFIISRFRKK